MSDAISDPKTADFIPAAYSARFTYYFARYVRRMIRKSFHAVRIMPVQADALNSLADHDGPVLVLLSHSSWWDPLISLALHDYFSPRREPMAPMDASQLRKFGVLKRIGIFGIDPDQPASLEAMGAYAAQRFQANPRCSLWITPQGRFTDVRSPIAIRPGGAAMAARTPGMRVLCLAIEYGFWTDQRPEVFLRWNPVAVPIGRERSTAAWHRAILEAMVDNNARLSEAVMSRDPAKFVPVFDSAGAAATNWWYDLWLKVRGRSVHVEDRHFAPDAARSRNSAG